MARELSRKDPSQEGNLLIEAVSLLVQRQRETESWVTEQLWQAEERAASTERRYAELEARLAELEDQLDRLAHDLDPGRADSAVDERLARLRDQVEGLKSGIDGRQARGVAPTPAAGLPPVSEPISSRELEPARVVGGRDAEARRVVPTAERRVATGARRSASTAPRQNVGFWELLGANAYERASALLIAAGAVALVYGVLVFIRPA